MIPAYNEEKHIEATLASLLGSGFPCEIIIVDDGSTDRTAEILGRCGPPIRLITHPSNRGKGAAMATGIRNATGEIVLFCDAHVQNLSQYHLMTLTLPLACGSARVVLGADIPKGVPLIPVYSPIALMLTGQRAYFREDLLPVLEELEALGYGVETFLNNRFQQAQTIVVTLPGLVHLTKRHTASPPAAVLAYVREGMQILDTLAAVQGLNLRERLRLNATASALLARSDVIGKRNGNTLH